MLAILSTLQTHLKNNTQVSFEVINPDLFSGSYAGTKVTLQETSYIYRNLRSWMDLATLLECRMLTPQHASKQTLLLKFEKLTHNSFHQETPVDKKEKYGVNSSFSAIQKNEEPAFLFSFKHALELAFLNRKKRILNLGINQGDEFALIQELLTPEVFKSMEFVGIDHSKSAIEVAKKRFNYPNMHFFAHDINALKSLNLGSFDLIISIGTLQSPGIEYKPFLMELVQSYLAPSASLVLGFPNSRWIDGEMIYGAKMRNYSESDLSLLLNDVDYAKRYLQQKKFSIRIQGKEYLFLTATK